MKTLVLFSFLSLAGCTSFQYSQRAYTDSDVLAGKRAPSENRRSDSTERGFKDGPFTMILAPVMESELISGCEKQAFREQWNRERTSECSQKAKQSFTSGKTCLHVRVTSKEPDSSNLKYFGFYLDGLTKVYKLTPLGTLGDPTEQGHVSSYSTGGYATTVGSYVSYVPPTTHVYSFSTFHNSGFFCSDSKADLSKGFAVVVQPRYEPDIPAIDFVWMAREEKSSGSRGSGQLGEFERAKIFRRVSPVAAE